MSIGSDIFADSLTDELSVDALFVAENSDESDDEGGDDPRDLTYVPPNETPNHRPHKKEPRDPRLAARCAAAAQHPGKCVYTGEDKVCGIVQYAHGTARHNGYTRPDLMLNLEYHWGFPTPYTLSLDTRKNIIPKNPTIHVANDNGASGLLPKLDDLMMIYNDSLELLEKPWMPRPKYNILWPPPIEDKFFLYNPVMFLFRPETAPPITHRDPVPDANGNRATTHHYCPYPNLELTLRLHPVFAIVDLYLKWVEYKDQVSWTGQEGIRMTYVQNIIEIWMKTPPAAWLKLRPQGFLRPGTFPALGKATKNGEENNDVNGTPSRRAAGQITLPDLGDGPLTAAETQAAIEDAIAVQSKTVKGKGKAVDTQFQNAPVAGPSNAHASTSGAVFDDEAPAQTKSGKKQAPSKARKRGREGDDEEEVDRPGKQSKVDVKGKGKPKASKSKQAAEVEAAEGESSKPKRSRKKSARFRSKI